MLNRVRPIYAYRKACKVIDSCTNVNQLVGAKKYINLFFKAYASELPGWSIVEYAVYENVAKMYSKLLYKHNMKHRKLS